MKKFFFLGGVALLAVSLWLGNVSLSFAAGKPIHYRWGSIMLVSTLDPKDQTSDTDYVVANNLYDTLVFPDPEKIYIPWMAGSWKASPDGLKFTFRLKKGIPFHDGSELTADDVVFSMDRLVSLGGSIASFFKTIKPGTTKALDPYTVEFNLTKRDPAFVHSLILFKILNKKLILKNLDTGNFGPMGDYGLKYLRTHEAGSGPFILEEYKHGDLVKMKRFDKYPLVPRQPGSADYVSIYTIPEVVTLTTKFKKGEFDEVHWGLPGKILKEFKADPNFAVAEHFDPRPWTVVINNQKKPLDCPNVRKAINYAFNKEVITSQILAGGKPLHGPIPEELRWGCADIVTYPYNVEKAKEVLKQSKYSAADLAKFKMDFAAVAGSERYKAVGLLFISDMKKIGLNVEVRAVRWSEICQAAKTPESAYHFSLLAQAAKVAHPFQYFIFYTPEGWGAAYPSGGIYYGNPKVTEAVQKGNSTTDFGEQKKYYCEAQKLIAEDAPVAFLHDDLRLTPFWKYVKGYKYPVGAMFFEHRFERFYMDTNDPMFIKNQGW